LGAIPCEFESRPRHYLMFEEKRKKLIISADDFGKSERANKNILELVRLGKLDRVSVMVEGDISEKETAELLATGVKLDIHFELVWQKRRRNLLIDKTLRQAIVFLVNYLWGDWPVPENPRSGARMVSREWEGQIEKFEKIFGRTPDGISSHEHTHFFPAYFKVALELAKKHGIPFIRFGKKDFLGGLNSVNLILKNMRRLSRKKFFRSKIYSSDYFVSLDWVADVKNFTRYFPDGKIELACHPERENEFEIIKKYF
jgi:chitin disaccharide deacetylase